MHPVATFLRDQHGRVHRMGVDFVLIGGLLTACLVLAWQRPVPSASIEPRSVGYRVDINTADAAEISLLPGLGPTLAQRVVEHRSEYGPFETMDDLTQVKGVGPRTLARVRLFAVAGTPAEADGQAGIPYTSNDD